MYVCMYNSWILISRSCFIMISFWTYKNPFIHLISFIYSIHNLTFVYFFFVIFFRILVIFSKENCMRKSVWYLNFELGKFFCVYKYFHVYLLCGVYSMRYQGKKLWIIQRKSNVKLTGHSYYNTENNSQDRALIEKKVFCFSVKNV